MKNLKVGWRMALGFGVLALITLGIAGLGAWGAKVIHDSGETATVEAQKDRSLGYVAMNLRELQLHLARLAHEKDLARKEACKQEFLTARQSYKKEFDACRREFKRRLVGGTKGDWLEGVLGEDVGPPVFRGFRCG